MSGACEQANLPRQTVYQWRDANPDFAAAWEEALEHGAEAMEDEARRRGVDGTQKPVYQGGKLVGHVQEYSDTLLIFLLKGRKPEKYRENSHIEHSGKLSLEQLVAGSLPKKPDDA